MVEVCAIKAGCELGGRYERVGDEFLNGCTTHLSNRKFRIYKCEVWMERVLTYQLFIYRRSHRTLQTLFQRSANTHRRVTVTFLTFLTAALVTRCGGSTAPTQLFKNHLSNQTITPGTLSPLSRPQSINTRQRRRTRQPRGWKHPNLQRDGGASAVDLSSA